MPSINAQVEAISIKEMPSPDKYGNSHRANIKVGEDWFSYGALKKPQIDIKSGGEWHELQKGMEVEFMYDVNGDFKNIKRQSFTITNTESAAPAPKPKTGGTQVPKNDNFVNPAEIGQCMNLAAEVLKFSGDDMLNPDKAVEAIQWYKRSRQLFTSMYPTVDTEDNKPPFKTQETQETQDEYDDSDI